MPGPCLPSEVNARCNSVVMASRSTGVACCAWARGRKVAAATKTLVSKQIERGRALGCAGGRETWGEEGKD